MSASRNKVLSLYKQMIREAEKFSSYNFRSYALRRIRDAFHENKSLSAPNEIEAAVADGLKSLDVIKRQAIIGQLYSADKLVIEKNN